MQDRKQACTVLGLHEEAGFQEIEHRYLILVKKYKHLADDEQPSPGEPVFATVNEAYRYLIGYAPLQKEVFGELDWQGKVRYIREHYMAEIVLFFVLFLLVTAVGAGIYAMYSVLQAGTGSSGVPSSAESVLPIFQNKAGIR